MGRILQIFILLFLFITRSYSQESSLVFKNISIDDGLSQNSVVDIAQDELGFMWFATQDGLNRYDGQDFKIFPEVFDDITSPNFSQLGKLSAKKNKLWFVSKGGKLKVMDLCTEDTFPVERFGKGMDLLPPVSTILEDSNNILWIGTLEKGLFQWDLKTNAYRNFNENKPQPLDLAGNEVRSIFEDLDGHIWILTNKGVTSIEAERNIHYLKGVNTNVITQDKEGRLWLGTFGEGLFVKEPNEKKFRRVENYGKENIPENLIIEAIHADESGNIWIGTYGSGLYLLNKDLQSTTQFMPERRNPFSIGFQDILSINEDREGAIWIGTDGGGVSYYNSHFHNFKRITGLDVSEDISISQIRAITTDGEGGIWLGTSGKGLTYLSADFKNNKTFHLKPYRPGIANYDRIVSLFVDKEEDLWIGTQGNGLLIKDIKTGKIKKWFFSSNKDLNEYIPDNTIWSILEAGPHRVFAVTRNAGILLIDKNTGLVKSYPSLKKGNSSFHKKNLRTITRVNDSILALGGEGNGIHLLNTCRGSFKTLNLPLDGKTLGERYGIKSLYYQNGYLWAGTSGNGLLITHLQSGRTTFSNVCPGAS